MQYHSNKLKKHKILIIASCIWWNPTAILKNGLQDINRPTLYLRDVSGITFTAVFVMFYIYPENFIPKYFILDDLLRKNHFHSF